MLSRINRKAANAKVRCFIMKMNCSGEITIAERLGKHYPLEGCATIMAVKVAGSNPANNSASNKASTRHGQAAPEFDNFE
jgi:hypothetical protein